MDFPKTFIDTKGRSWTVEIGWGTFGRIKTKTGIDLDSLVPRKGMSEAEQQETMARYLELIYSSKEFPAVLMVILDSQMKAAGVSEADFMDGFETSEAIAAITDAFKQALLDFTRDPLQRLILQKMMLGVARMQAIAMRKLDKRTEQLMTQMETDLEAKIDSALKSTSTDSPASLESIPKSPDLKE